jgi:predicted RNA-binding protein with RPS1 domain
MTEINFDNVKAISDEALMLSIVKLLVFQKLKRNKSNVNELKIKEMIEKKDDNFFRPNENDLQNQKNFNTFLEKLSNSIVTE